MIKKLIASFLILFLTKDVTLANMTQFKLKTDDLNITNNEIIDIIDAYEENIYKIIKKEDSTISYRRKLKKFGLGYPKDLEQYQISSSLGRIAIKLEDGDYAVWNSTKFDMSLLWERKGKRKIQYAAEYHKDGSLMGIVKMKRVDKNTIAFFEYRIEDIKKDSASMKHIVFYSTEKEPIILMLTQDGNIKAYNYKGIGNMADISRLNLSSLDKSNAAGDVAYIIGQTAIGALQVVGGVALVPLAAVAWPVLMVTFMVNEAVKK